jgi:hypothetical protein
VWPPRARMSTAATAGFFTLGVPADRYQLPHPLLGLPVILLIRRVLLKAFEKLRERGFPLATEKEDRITEQLFNIIENDLRQTGEINGFASAYYDRVVRHAQVTNYNGQELAKTPDLSFKLRHADSEPRPVVSAQDALFIECKPVDADHPAGSAYCDDGLIRFVRGDYAWAMQEGMMLAYARDRRTIAGQLIPAMSEPARMVTLATNQLPVPSSAPAALACVGAEAIHISRHHRSLPWPDGKGPATDITVYHLWHQCG